MRRILTTAVATGAMVLASSTIAVAGEYDGNGNHVPGGVRGASLCSFSGLDIADDLEDNPPGRNDDDVALNYHGVQSYGQFVSLGANLRGTPLHPGSSCNPNIGLPDE